MIIKDTILKYLGISTLTKPSLQKAITYCNKTLSNKEKIRITRKISLSVIQQLSRQEIKTNGSPPPISETLSDINVLAVNHAGPLDVTIEWKSLPDGTLTLKGYRLDPGGDQINVSKVFSNFDTKIALVALAGQQGMTVTEEWERSFLNKYIFPVLIRSNNEDQQAAVYNTIEGDTLPAIFGWKGALSAQTVDEINLKVLGLLEKIFEEQKNNIWLVFSAGGPLTYDPYTACYRSLVECVKRKYQNRVNMLIDFKFMAGPEEAMSVIDIQRQCPQDIIKPNLQEFKQILVSSGIAEPDMTLEKITNYNLVKHYAVKLRERYNLAGVLVSMDRNGLMLVLEDRVIREKGIEIKLECHTAAGDSLKAGFVYALSRGMSFEEAVHMGNLFGASTASLKGSQTVTPEVLGNIQLLSQQQKISPRTEFLK